MLRLEGDEVDEHVCARSDRGAQRFGIRPIDHDMRRLLRNRQTGAAPEDDLPPPLLQPSRQPPPCLTGAAEQERALGHAATIAR
jgi:hypothetical protein